jgi:hypothetical protein
MRLVVATGVSAAAQVVHGLVPADTEAEGYVGLVGGLLLLVGTLAALYGFRVAAGWARRLAGLTGLVGAVGVTAYHLAPVTSPVTNPYPGEGVGAAAWLSVLAVVAAGLWCGYEAWLGDPADRPPPCPTG